MRYIKQFLIILLISFIGEVLNYLIPLPVPASIYGLVVMFVCLKTGFFKLSTVEDTGKFLIEIMPLMFIPSSVGLMKTWGILKPILFPALLISVVSTVAVMAVTGRFTQFIIRRDRANAEKKSKTEEYSSEEITISEGTGGAE